MFSRVPSSTSQPESLSIQLYFKKHTLLKLLIIERLLIEQRANAGIPNVLVLNAYSFVFFAYVDNFVLSSPSIPSSIPIRDYIDNLVIILHQSHRKDPRAGSLIAKHGDIFVW